MGDDPMQATVKGSSDKVLRIGVVTEPLGDQDALRFLILKLNGLQHSFEFELVTPRTTDSLLEQLVKPEIDREQIKKGLVELAKRLKVSIINDNNLFGCSEPPPDHFVVLSKARFIDNYMSTRAPD